MGRGLGRGERGTALALGRWGGGRDGLALALPSFSPNCMRVGLGVRLRWDLLFHSLPPSLHSFPSFPLPLHLSPAGQVINIWGRVPFNAGGKVPPPIAPNNPFWQQMFQQQQVNKHA